ncbi:putative addiction module killer protein [Luteibacter rhizovicinus]|uniref:Putative addiction module killer protein n=1 Tax=Luteibacter rhizovicinus TaxID=242606 RepID=A0A4R3Z196_9GAMM|nr:type II toxin-antitoxin system RelE/ParE family toxin [Luteibacter rhizovicinus]TCV97533.1 putative addiction module killer protein [Luteibacter rhizovicinus]
MGFAVKQAGTFAAWHKGVKDMKARIAIGRRIERASHGNFGDSEPVGEGVSEMRVDVGAGYRVYYVVRGKKLVILLCGGDKRTQQSDIKKARGDG